MKSITIPQRSPRALLGRLQALAPHLIFGTLSETYRTCGRPGCRCQHGEKHGPHLYVSFRGPDGRTAGYYVPQALATTVRTGVAAWQEAQTVLRTLAEANREQLWTAHASPTRQSERRAHGPSRVPSAKPRRSAAAGRRQALGRRAARHRRRPGR